MRTSFRFPLDQFVCAMFLMAAGLGCSRPKEISEAAAAVYVCRDTGTVFSGPLKPTPAVNPATGQATLVRGLYCRQCQKWRAAPPPGVHAGNPLSWPCPRHKKAMSYDGPLPDNATYLPTPSK